PALLVDHLEIAFVGVVLDLGGGLRTGEDLPGAELDLRVGDAHLVLFGRPADLLGDGRGGLVQVGGRGSGSGAAGGGGRRRAGGGRAWGRAAGRRGGGWR